MSQSEITGPQSAKSETTQESSKRAARPRGVTMLKLQWLAERVRKIERIKKQVEAGTYSVDSREVAKRVLGFDGSEEI